MHRDSNDVPVRNGPTTKNIGKLLVPSSSDTTHPPAPILFSSPVPSYSIMRLFKQGINQSATTAARTSSRSRPRRTGLVGLGRHAR